MTGWGPIVLEGRVTRLEPLATAHLDGLWEASRAPRTWQWLPVVQPTERSAFDALQATAIEAGADRRELPFATVERSSGRVVGSTRFLSLRPEHRSAEIGWTWLSPDAFGTGINTEAKLLMLRHAFEREGCRRVEFKTDALNERARGALLGIGATFEGVHRKHMLVRGGMSRDSAWYAVTDDDWPTVQDVLVARLARHV